MALIRYWQRLGCEEDQKVSYWCKCEILQSEMKWAKGIRETVTMVCRELRVDVCQQNLQPTICKKELRILGKEISCDQDRQYLEENCAFYD